MYTSLCYSKLKIIDNVRHSNNNHTTIFSEKGRDRYPLWNLNSYLEIKQQYCNASLICWPCMAIRLNARQARSTASQALYTTQFPISVKATNKTKRVRPLEYAPPNIQNNPKRDMIARTISKRTLSFKSQSYDSFWIKNYHISTYINVFHLQFSLASEIRFIETEINRIYAFQDESDNWTRNDYRPEVQQARKRAHQIHF